MGKGPDGCSVGQWSTGPATNLSDWTMDELTDRPKTVAYCLLTKRRNDELLDDFFDAAAVGPALFAHCRGRGRDNDEVEAWHEHDVLSAETPRVVRLTAGHLADPPTVTVHRDR